MFLVNILSFAHVRDNFVVEYDHKTGTFIILFDDDSTTPFIRSSRGLHYHAVRWNEHSTHTHVFVNTVADNMRLFTTRQVHNAEKARQLYIMLGRPSPRVFKYMLQHNVIQNTTVTYDYAHRAELIFGTDLGSLKGKSVRTTPAPVVLPSIIPVPAPIFSNHREVILCGDIFYMDK